MAWGESREHTGDIFHQQIFKVSGFKTLPVPFPVNAKLSSST
jgi:hypothetical protein